MSGEKESLPERFQIGSVSIGANHPVVLISGPCAVESHESCITLACELSRLAAMSETPYVFKASYKKANRSRMSSFHGVGLEAGLQILSDVGKKGIPTLTDVHESAEIPAVAQVVSCIQIPALLCRQTDLIVGAGRSGVPVNVKKGPFLAPQDVVGILDKISSTPCPGVAVTERGTSFGYRDLVVDFRGFVVMKKLGVPLIFDASHSIKNASSAGMSPEDKFDAIQTLSRAAICVGFSAVYIEVHEDPSKAFSDGEISLSLDQIGQLLPELAELGRYVRRVKRGGFDSDQ